MSDQSYTDALVAVSSGQAVLSSKMDGLAGQISRLEETLDQINGNVREHGEKHAANEQWVEGHKQEHTVIDERMRTLSSRVWQWSCGSGLLGGIALLLQRLGQ